jgi:hypothetical protein
MKNVLVVSRNATLGVGLVHQGYDVHDVRPDRHGDWTREARVVDVVVLELSDAVAAESAVLRLRAEGIGVPVLVVANPTPGWETTAEHVGLGTAVLPLPISLPNLITSIEALIASGPIEVPPPPRNEEELLSAVAASVGLSITDGGTVVNDPSPASVPRITPPDLDAPPDPAGEALLAAAVEAAPEAPAPEPDPLTDPLPLAEPQPVAVAQPEPVRTRPAGVPMPAPPAAARPGEPRPPASDEHVAALLAWARDLTGVAECAEVVVAELAERVGAEAAALLLPDGPEWRVAGGTGLRPLEERARIGEDHWLVKNVVLGGEGVITDDTDAVREELAGAPLASWQRMLAVPVPHVRGLFVAARSGEAFGDEAIAAAVAVGAEAAPLLQDALAVRALARALAPYAETGDE